MAGACRRSGPRVRSPGPAVRRGRRAGRDPATFHDRIEYRGISFSYDGAAPVLQDVTSTFGGPGRCDRRPVGAGRPRSWICSTVYEPTRGAILMDGVSVAQFTRSSLRGLMDVSQETILLNDTVLANIAYGGRIHAGPSTGGGARGQRSRLRSQLPEGYHTLLGERGTRSRGDGSALRSARPAAGSSNSYPGQATSALDMESERLSRKPSTGSWRTARRS